MGYTLIVAVGVALIAISLMYRRRKNRKPVHMTYGYVGFLPGQENFEDRIEFCCGRRRN